MEVEAGPPSPLWTDSPLSDEEYDTVMARLRRRGAAVRASGAEDEITEREPKW